MQNTINYFKSMAQWIKLASKIDCSLIHKKRGACLNSISFYYEGDTSLYDLIKIITTYSNKDSDLPELMEVEDEVVVITESGLDDFYRIRATESVENGKRLITIRLPVNYADYQAFI